MPEVTLRSGTAGDIDAVLHFWQSAAEGAHRPPDTTTALDLLVARDPDALILAEVDGELVGTVIAGWDGWRCHIYRLAVAPGSRRQGVGRRLIEAAEERFRGVGGTRVDAMVLNENDRAHGAWRAGGYHPQPEWSRWIKPLD